jgi:hypothetical protein
VARRAARERRRVDEQGRGVPDVRDLLVPARAAGGVAGRRDGRLPPAGGPLIARLLLASLLELLAGLGFAAALGLPPGVAYLAGLAIVGILSAHLALVHVTYGWTALALTAAVAVGAGLARRGARGFARDLRPHRPSLPGALALAFLLVLFARAWPAFAGKQLDDYDAWALWGMKAKALTLLGWADPGLFAARIARPLNLEYPLLLPSLEAVAARAMGRFDPQLIHLQFLFFAVALFAALHGLMRDRAPAWTLFPVLAALAVAPAFSGQLLTAYADIPLACFVAGGLVAAARWIDEQTPSLLALATLFFAAAALTKKEGLLFAGAALVALLLTTRRWRPLLFSALAVEALLLPWQIWRAFHYVPAGTSSSLDFLHHPGIGPLIGWELLKELFSPRSWSLLLPLFLIGVVLARTRLALFASAWVVLSAAGLGAVYLTSTLEWTGYFSLSGYRVVDSIVVGAAAMTPLLFAGDRGVSTPLRA